MKIISNQHPPRFEALENRQLLSAGQLDPTFGDGGKVVTNQGLAGGTSGGVAVQADGKLLVGAQGDGYQGFNLIRYNNDGSVDTSFGDDGIAKTRHDDMLQAMLVQADGKILLAGLHSDTSGTNFTMSTVITRFNSNGTLDTDFGDGGVVILPGDTYSNAGPLQAHATFSPGNVKLATQVDGKIILTQILGDDGTTSGADLNVIRLNEDGTLDSSFGTGGKAVIELRVMETPKDLVIQADGKIVVSADGYSVVTSGNSTSWPSLKTFLIRLNDDGTFDNGFGTDGVVTENATLWQINASKLAIGLDGKLLLLGEEMSTTRSVESFLIRYNTDGTRDTDFGTGGRTVLDPGDGGSVADLLVQPDGKLLLSGETSGPSGRPSMLSQRLNEDGTLDTGYGDGGNKVVSVGSSFDYAGAMALQQDGGILITGFSDKIHSETSNDLSDIALIRLEGDAGSAGSAHASLRRGKDQQAPYLGKNKFASHQRSPKRTAMELAAQAAAATGHHRSPKRIAMEIAAKVQQALADGSHRSPKRLSMEVAAAIFSTTEI